MSHIKIDRQIDRQDRQKDKWCWVGGWVDGCMCRWVDGWMDR